MANQRIFLWALLALVLWFNYDAWQRDYAPKPTPAPAAESSEAPGAVPATAPPRSGLDEAPALPSSDAAPSAAPEQRSPEPEPATASGDDVRVLTDVLDLRIGLQGGDLKRADLLKYPKDKHNPQDLVRLFNDDPAHAFIFRSGLTSGTPGTQPDHLATFNSPAREYRLADSADEVRVPLTWTDGRGLTVTKTYTFRRGQYTIALEYAIDNQSGQEWRAAPYVQFSRKQLVVKRSMFDVESYAFMGPAIYAPDGEKYRKLELDDDEDVTFSEAIKNGWLAAMQHHFVAAALPTPDLSYDYSLRVENGQYVLGAVGPALAFAPGARATVAETLFVGPKLQHQLETLHPELDRTADYGMLYFLANPLFTLLEWVHNLTGNWGWAIVLVTVLIKLVFYPLSEASGRSMAKMRALAPRIKNIQERYKDDREQLGRQMMELYKREKINPLAGCLPIVVQIPVFLAFYWVLLESVEMRQAPFMLWIDDLSSRDPFFVLPLLMGAAMFGQYKLNPAPPDPMQAKVFMFMPIIMTVMFAWFPAGLVLYWLTNTVLSIAQQWRINRVVEAQAKKHAT